jgi:hypothetical protein
MEWFDTLSLIAKPRDLNAKVYAIAISATKLQICDDLMKNGKVEVFFIPSVPYNFIKWQVFDDDA